MNGAGAAPSVEANSELDRPRAARGEHEITLLGPQALKPTLNRAVDAAGIRGKIATITAGWQEREREDQELHTHLAGRTVNLRLYDRAEELYARDPSFAATLHSRQERLRELQLYYDLRLRYAMEACVALDARAERGERGERGEVLEVERREAMGALRALDAEHARKIRSIHEEFDVRLRAKEPGELSRHRGEIARTIQDCDAVAIAGGHVAVLLNRLRLFSVGEAIGVKPLFAWSAGAMAISERIVLYHDSPPQGPGNAEVLEFGLGHILGIVPLPHAHRRMLLDDAGRVARFARRFSPASCVAMEDGASLTITASKWTADGGVRRLSVDGTLEEMLAG